MSAKSRSASILLARAVISTSRWTPLRGLGGYGMTDDQAAAEDPTRRFRQAFAERDGVGAFYRFFPDLPDALVGKAVLDFGCGYGGKAVEFARSARFVAAVEPFENMIRAARDYAEHEAAANVEFRVCEQDRIPYDDESFDLVLSHDVIEHVDDPETSLREIRRVLRPGGRAYIVFPPYRATPPAGVTDLSQFPRSLVLASPTTAWLHAFAISDLDLPTATFQDAGQGTLLRHTADLVSEVTMPLDTLVSHYVSA